MNLHLFEEWIYWLKCRIYPQFSLVINLTASVCQICRRIMETGLPCLVFLLFTKGLNSCSVQSVWLLSYFSDREASGMNEILAQVSEGFSLSGRKSYTEFRAAGMCGGGSPQHSEPESRESVQKQGPRFNLQRRAPSNPHSPTSSHLTRTE